MAACRMCVDELKVGTDEGGSSEIDNEEGGKSDISPSLDPSAYMHGRGGGRPQR